MAHNSKRILTWGIALILVCQCAWFKKDLVDDTLLKPTPIGGYESLSSRIHYPNHMREQGIEGAVEVRAHISETGEVVDVVVSTSLHPELDQIVTNAVKRTRFHPATRSGNPTDVWIAIPFIFALSDWQDDETPFTEFQMVVHPDPAYANFHVEMSGRIDNTIDLPVRLECLLPVNHANHWVKTSSGTAPQKGLVRDNRGEWLIVEVDNRGFSFGFDYHPIFEQENGKLQYGFALNHKLPEWTLAVIYGAQRVVFEQEPDRISDLKDGSKRFEYDMERLDAYETRYLEIALDN